MRNPPDISERLIAYQRREAGREAAKLVTWTCSLCPESAHANFATQVAFLEHVHAEHAQVFAAAAAETDNGSVSSIEKKLLLTSRRGWVFEICYAALTAVAPFDLFSFSISICGAVYYRCDETGSL